MNAFGIERDGLPADRYDRLLARRRREKAVMRLAVALFIVGVWGIVGGLLLRACQSTKAQRVYERIDQGGK